MAVDPVTIVVIVLIVLLFFVVIHIYNRMTKIQAKVQAKSRARRARSRPKDSDRDTDSAVEVRKPRRTVQLTGINKNDIGPEVNKQTPNNDLQQPAAVNAQTQISDLQQPATYVQNDYAGQNNNNINFHFGLHIHQNNATPEKDSGFGFIGDTLFSGVRSFITPERGPLSLKK